MSAVADAQVLWAGAGGLLAVVAGVVVASLRSREGARRQDASAEWFFVSSGAKAALDRRLQGRTVPVSPVELPARPATAEQDPRPVPGPPSRPHLEGVGWPGDAAATCDSEVGWPG